MAAGIIFSGGRVLICRRPENKKLEAGKWEFPGGKREEGESLWQALKRELKEELDIDISEGGLYDARVKLYGNGTRVLVTFYKVTAYTGEIKAIEHSEVKFVEIGELTKYDLADADRRAAQGLINDREATDA